MSGSPRSTPDNLTDATRRARLAAGLLTAAWLAAPGLAAGQTGDFSRPQVLLQTGGQSAPPRALVFTPDGLQLLSAGQDKAVYVWNLDGGRPRFTRAIRPPVWRGLAGVVQALALSPRTVPGRPDQRWLAVAGHSVVKPVGKIGLYAFPGDPARPTGELLTLLPPWAPGAAIAAGHRDSVTALAFSPDGATLASAGNDGRVILWDPATRAERRVLEVPGASPAHALAFSADGASVVAGDQLGRVHVWETAGGRRLVTTDPVRKRPDADPRGDRILCLTANPTGPLAWVVVGREDGWLLRYDVARDGRLVPVELPTRADQGPVLAVGVNPAGDRLVTSVIRRRINTPADRPALACDVELRSLPDGRVVGPNALSDGLVQAVAFGPAGRFLAFGGGESQALTVRDLTAPDRPAVELKGAGRSVWDLGWTADSRAVGFAQDRVDPPGVAPEFRGFHLVERRPVDVVGANLRRSLSTWNGYSVRPADPMRLTVTTPAGAQATASLDAARDGRWWGYTIVPDGPGHPRPTLAVGCEMGVVVFELATGGRLRVLAGHNGPVYAVAPSPDGRWLATGSADQTVRVWRLAGTDQPARLGLTLRREADGRTVVDAVTPLGFADRDRMRLRPGDVLKRAFVDAAEFPPDRFADWLARADAIEPNRPIELVVQRGADALPMVTTKRDGPALSLFVGLDGEWVVWTPEGYYDTSAAGDRRYLAWQKNGADPTQPTDVFPADRFERELRLPQVISILMTTADPAQALAAVPAASRDPETLVAAGAPPVVRIERPAARTPDGAVVTDGAPLVITPDVVANDGRSPIRSVTVQVENRPAGGPGVFAAPVNGSRNPVTVADLPPGRSRVVVRAENAAGKVRVEGFDVVSTARPKAPPRLRVLSVGVPGPFAGSLAPIAYADLDARDVPERLAGLGKPAYGAGVGVLPVVTATAATADQVLRAFDALNAEKLGPGDSVVVVLESHFLTGPDGRVGFFAGSDTAPASLPTRAVPAESLADLLAGVAAGGCRVLLLVDAVHDAAPVEWTRSFREWSRALYNRGVITFLATNRGPGRRVETALHGAFAQAVIDAPTARGLSRPWLDPKASLTLDDFQLAVTRRVQELTQRKQQSLCLVPETVSPQSPLFDPRADEAGPPR